MSPAALKRALDPAYIGSPFAQPFQFFDGDVSTPMDLTGRAVVLFLDRQGPPHAHHEITGVIQTDGRVLFSAADTSAWIKGDYSLEVRLDGVSVVVGRIVVAKGAGASGSDMVGAAQPPTAPGVVIAGSGVVQVVSVAPSAATDPSGIILPQDLSAALGGAETLADALLWLAQNGGTPSPILRDLIGGVVISSVATGALSVAAAGQVLLSGAISSASSAAGSLTVGAASSIALVGTAVSTSSLTGAMTVVTQIALAGSAAGTSAVAGSLTVATDVIGGMAVGQPGAAGTFREGYTLSGGDDFATLDILAPHRPRGKWWTTRTYLAGARGSDTLLGTQYDTDPFHTGYNDSNKGVPVGYDNMRVAASVLSLQARRATTQEKAHFSPGAVGGRQQVAAMISGVGAIHWYPGPQDTGDIIYEARLRFSAKAGNPLGWHPTLWCQSLNPVVAIESDEIDWEGNSHNIGFGFNRWTGGSGAGTAVSSRIDHDGQWHDVSMVLSLGRIQLYIDGVLFSTGSVSANTKAKPQYPLITSHVYAGTFEGDTYSQASWDADADGAILDVDYLRVWRRTGRAHYKPLASVADVNVAYGASTTITLPSKADLWGDATATDYLQVAYNEENEPGVQHSTPYTQLPLGVTYNAVTRQVTVNVASGKTGRLNFIMSAWKDDGATGEPLRFAVNVGPRLAISSLNFDAGATVSYDLRAVCDVGVLNSTGAARADTIAVTGLPSGLSYSDVTGLLTGTAPAGATVANATVTITNSLGQSVATPLTVSINAVVSGVPYTEWTGPAWFDASDSLVVSGSTVTGMTNKRSGGNLTGAGTAANRTRVAAGRNGLDILRLVRDVSGNATTPRLESAIGTTLTALAEGEDKPFTMLLAYTPTDANTGFPAAWSNNNGTEAQIVGLVRRAASASSVRRQLVTAAGNDVNFGSGQPSASSRIVAIRHTGIAVTVWDTSVGKSISEVAQNTAALTTGKIFRLGSAIIAPAGQQNTACSMDLYEVVVDDTARPDDDIVVSIQALAAKWGITLT